MNHEYDGDCLRRGTEEQDPHGRDISNQVDRSDPHIYDRDGDPGVSIFKEVKGGVVQLYGVGVCCHDQRALSPVWMPQSKGRGNEC